MSQGLCSISHEYTAIRRLVLGTLRATNEKRRETKREEDMHQGLEGLAQFGSLLIKCCGIDERAISHQKCRIRDSTYHNLITRSGSCRVQTAHPFSTFWHWRSICVLARPISFSNYVDHGAQLWFAHYLIHSWRVWGANVILLAGR